MSSGVYITVYCFIVLVMLVVVGYGYWAWQGYRRAMRDALVRRHERDVERGEHMEQDNYWRRTDPRSPPSLIEAVPVAFHTSYIKTAETYTTGAKSDL
ncbi:hypothetical protein JG687_00009549 [Phytophthora cactorum]|uniref:Uncharacterized protein n=1 Tax=Phytophthora cactorum TaxID=29920 RepID=A0A329SY43_9STRA|nr:hypothetical protein GQ600_18510 [Phytophthora cactorum]KAG2777476.1 hypothetical protein Pcac1_g12099 [Phytophthora cactorum]KAG2825325.1 hypothetical protein PC112_g9736 [Phytophthora cactorum]KAG2827662.1 hypothetical protein PC111_g8504 [Phytophthora cactorum]KAG2858346.1 hypothetical protein PC113_g9892 [Phytophthora cactorum]